jgi:hypothetical protein
MKKRNCRSMSIDPLSIRTNKRKVLIDPLPNYLESTPPALCVEGGGAGWRHLKGGRVSRAPVS